MKLLIKNISIQNPSERKNFVICTLILTMIYSCGSLLYYSQTFLLYRFCDTKLITEILSGWAYIFQATGMGLYAIFHFKNNGLPGKSKFQTAVTLSLIPVILLSVFSENGRFLIFLVILLNILIGLQTAYAFSLIAACVAPKLFARSFAAAYSIGGIITFLISRINRDIMTSYPVIFFACVLVGITLSLLLTYEDADQAGVASRESSFFPEQKKQILSLGMILAFMAVIIALGTNDPILVESGSQIHFLTTRLFYAAGLIIAAFLFDYDPFLSSICTLASILYPLLVIMLYRELPISLVMVGLTDTFVGFFAVYRAGTFLSIASESGRFYLAAFGLCISRIAEGSMVILAGTAGFGRLTSFLLAGIMFVPLIILFGYSLRAEKKPVPDSSSDIIQPQPAAELPVSELPSASQSFADLYHLTRRESEIAELLAENKTNGEIAEILCVSESTVRFHVSNILKKTGMKNRIEVGRSAARLR